MYRYIFTLSLILAIIGASTAQVQVTISGTASQHTIHPMIQGFGLVYSHEPDSIYDNGSMPQVFNDVGASFLRWPGGAITPRYHWNDLTGRGWADTWNPNYNPANNLDSSLYMDLDEYMTLCAQANTEPMLGINMSSGMEWNRQADGLQEAIDLINYCKNKNFDVKYFFLDNETYHSGNLYNSDPNNDGNAWTAATYANQINIYAPAIRALVPDAKLIANWTTNFQNDPNLSTLITQAGSNFDYLDVHWYWKWGTASYAEWKSKTPMEYENQWYNGGTFPQEVAYFNNLMSQLGQPHIKLASLEWNIGPGPWETDPSHTKYKTALIHAEMQMQFMQAGLEVASLWANQWRNTADSVDRFLVDADDGYVPNPTAKVFKMYKHAINGELVSSSVADTKIMNATVIKDNKAYIYLLNKNNANKTTEFQVEGYDVLGVDTAFRFMDPGVYMPMGLWQVNGNYRANLWGNTLTMIVLDVEPKNMLRNGDFENGLTHWNSWNNPTTTHSNAYYGNQAAQLNGKASINQWVRVKPNTTYTLSAYAKVDDPQNERVVLGVKRPNRTNLGVLNITDPTYTLQQIMFTTGAKADSVKVFFWRPPNGKLGANLDEVVLKETSYAINADFEKGMHAWSYWGGAGSIEQLNPIAGSTSARIVDKGGINQWIKVKPATTYRLEVMAYMTNPSLPLLINVKNSTGLKYVNNDTIVSTQPGLHVVTFSTDPNDEDAKVGFFRPKNSSGYTYIDNIRLLEVSASAAATNSNKNETTKQIGNHTFNLEVWQNRRTATVTVFSSEGEYIRDVALYNVMGANVLKTTHLAGQSSFTFSVMTIPPGLYVVFVTDINGRSISKKVLLNP